MASALGSKSSSLIESKANRWLLELTKELGEQFVEFVSYIRFSESQVKVIQETGLQLRHLVISKWFDIIGDHTTKYQYFVYDALRNLKRQDLLDKYFKKGPPEEYSEDILTDFLEALHAVDFSNLESRKSRQGNGQKEKVKEKDSKDMCSTDDTTQEVSTEASASYCPRNPTLERERTNFARICIVVIDVITEVFQKLLQVQLPGSELTDALQKQKSKVIRHLNKRQKEIIYPQKVASADSVQDFDISLVYILLRNLATIQAHGNDWGNEPDTKDRSLSANIDRLRIQRNKVAHATIASLSDEDFDERWTIICQSVKDIHDNELKTGSFVMKMEDLRTGRIDSRREHDYISLVTEIKDEMKGLKETMKNLAGAMEGHKKKLDKTTAKVESMQESQQQPANITKIYGPLQLGNNNQMTNDFRNDPGDGIEEIIKNALQRTIQGPIGGEVEKFPPPLESTKE